MCKHIVVIGGGNGLSNLIEGLIQIPNLSITAMPSVMDSGGSAGKLREEFGVIAFGDVRRSIAALSNDPEIKKLFEYRFANNKLKGHTFGNLFLMDLTKKYGSEKKAFEQCLKILGIQGKIVPTTYKSTNLVAKLENGKEIFDETNIDVPKHNANLKIKKLYLKPKVKIDPEAKKEIKNADIIIIGPGDLFTSVIANLIVDGVPEAIKKSKAKKIYIANLTNKLGETANYSFTDHCQEICNYLGRDVVDYVIYQNKPVGEDPIKLPFNLAQGRKVKFIGGDFLPKNKKLVHDQKKIIKTIIKCIM